MVTVKDASGVTAKWPLYLVKPDAAADLARDGKATRSRCFPPAGIRRVRGSDGVAARRPLLRK